METPKEDEVPSATTAHVAIVKDGVLVDSGSDTVALGINYGETPVLPDSAMLDNKVVVGIKWNEADLNALTSHPEEEHVFTVTGTAAGFQVKARITVAPKPADTNLA